MSFANSIFILIGVVVVFLLATFYIAAFVSRNRGMEKFADKKLLSEITASLDRNKRKIKMALIAVAVFLSFLGMARLQWGFEWEQLEHEGIDVIFAVDTSKSMLAEDIKPNRLERVKLEIEYFIKNLIGDRVGLIIFSGNAFLQCPVTVDYNGFLLNLQILDTEMLPKEGTSIAAAIDEGIDAYKRSGRKDKVVILITDGEDHEGRVVEAAQKAQAEGIKIFCVGIGSEIGSNIPIKDKNQNVILLKNNSGNVVKTRLDDKLLKKIAFITGGSYTHASEGNFGLESLYRERLSKIKKEALETKTEKRPKERFFIFLIPALIILLLEPFISETKRRMSL